MEANAILFTGTIRNSKDEYITPQPLGIEYYFLPERRWRMLVQDLPTDKGKFEYRFSLESKLGADLRPAMEAGFLPTLRLIYAESTEKAYTQVLSFGSLVAQVKPDEVMVDFGDLWIIESGSINHNIPEDLPDYEYTTVALPRPNGNNKLYEGLKFVIGTEENPEAPPAAAPPPVFTVPDLPKSFELQLNAIAEPERKVLLLREELDLKNLRVNILDNQAIQKDQTINELDNRIKLLNTEVQTEKASVQSLKAEKLQLEQTLTRKEEELVELRNNAGNVSQVSPLNAVYKQLAQDVEAASDELESSRFALTDVRIDLKTHIINDAEGIKVQLLDNASANTAKEGTFSSLNVRIAPKRQAPTASKVAVPDFTGLTENAAKKRAAEWGLKVMAIDDFSETRNFGAAFRQVPAAGQELPESGIVRIFFAKKQTDPNG